jgi:hypothetical protein
MSDASAHRPAAPSDVTTLTEVLAAYAASGYDTDFSVTPEGKVRVGWTGPTLAADQLELQSLRRLEGASDPADMTAVAAVRAPDGTLGTMVLRYGPEATEEEARVLQTLHDERRSGHLPPARPSEPS